MSNWVKVAELAELDRRGRKLVVVGEERIALFLSDGEVFAFRDSCVHKNRSLAKGTVLHGRVICPGHQWAFDLRTGQADDRPECQPTYPAKAENGHIWILPEPHQPAAATAPSPVRLPEPTEE